MTGPSGRPVPQGDYVPATRHGSLIFTAGMTPRNNGVLMWQGRVGSDALVEDWREPVVLACHNALTAARGVLAEGEYLSAIMSMTVYIAAEDGFTAHSRLADYASSHLAAELGRTGIGSRAAVGVASLPGGAPVEVQIVAAVQAGPRESH